MVDANGLTTVYQVCIAGVEARLLVEQWSTLSTASFAKRRGQRLQAPGLPVIQYDNKSTMAATGQVSLPLSMKLFRENLRAYATDLSS